MIRRAWALLSVVPIFVGASVVLGCFTALPLLVQFSVDYLSLGFNVAACFLLAGIGLLLYIYPSDVTEHAQILIGLLLMVFALATVSQDIFNINLHIDQLVIVPGMNTAFNPHPGRMAPNTAVAFFVLGLVYVLWPMTRKRVIGICIETLIFVIFLIGVLSLSGYIWKLEFLYSWFSYRGMSLPTSVCIIFLSIALGGLWRSNPASTALYQGREDTRIVLLSSGILLCMALSITIANFSSLIRQQDDAIGLSFQRLQKSRSIYFQNEVVHAIQEMNAIRSSQIFQNAVAKNADVVSIENFQSILKLFTAEGFTSVMIYDSKGDIATSTGHFIQQAVFNVKEKITNGYINVLWKNGWYVQIASDIDPHNKKAGLLLVEWALTNIDKVFSPTQVMGATGDMAICMPAAGGNITCFSSRSGTVSNMPEKINNYFVPAYHALHGKSGLVSTEDDQSRRILAAYGPIGVLSLGMVVDMSMAEIYEPITASLRTMVPVIALTIMIGLLLLRLQVMPLVRRVINAEKDLINSNKRLEESEDRYALAVRGSSFGLWDWDILSEKVFYSPYFKGMLGYSETEFPNTIESFKNALHPDDYGRVFHIVEEHLNNQVPYDVEYRLKRKTGDYHWFNAKGLALLDENGKPLRMAGSLIDVTERKKSEQRLAAQYAVIQLLSTATSLDEVAEKIVQAICEYLEWDFGSLWIVDNQTSMIRCVGLWHQPVAGINPLVDATRHLESPMGEGLAGRVWETGQHLWVLDVSTEKNFSRAPQAKEAGLHSAFSFPICIQNKVLGALEFMMRQRQSPDEAMLKMMVAITTQIGQFAQRRMAEWSLRENESYKAAVLESASDSIMTISAEGSILSFNHRTSEIFGYQSAELNHNNINLLMPGLAKKLKSLAGKVATEVLAKHKNGDNFPIEITISKMYLSKQNVLVCIIRDITERKKIEKLKNEFVSVVSHELRTPITSIRGSLGLILGGQVGSFSEQAAKLLVIANNNCDRLLLLMNDILDIEKIEAGKMEFQFKPIDIKKLINETIIVNQVWGQKYGVKISFKKPESDMLVYVDPDRLMQVMNNLVSNAVKFSSPGGTVDIAIEQLLDMVRVTVMDTGVGIPEEFHANIFQKFSQADSSPTRDHAGTGLGLSISKAIIEKFGGTLGFTSKPNEKTIFYFDLPRWHQVDTEEESTPQAPAVHATIRFLICEDDEDQANYLRHLLESVGYVADIAASVAQAKKRLQEVKYNVLLLDLILPDQDGITFIRELRNDETTHLLPIVVISALAETGRELLHGDIISVIDWLDKPVDFNKLLRVIDGIGATSVKRTSRILHVEDDADTRRIIETLLQDIAEVFSVDSLAKARAIIEKEKFDLVILDLILPDGNSSELFPILAKHYLPVIVLSSMELDYKYARFVHDALVKSKISNEDLLKTIRKIIEKSS
jgi:PAS domain S-box-containing protein